MTLSWPQPGSHAAVPTGIAGGGATELDAPDVAPRRDGGLDGKGAAALASGFDEAIGDDPLGLVDAVGSGRGRDGRNNAVAAPNIATDGGRRTAEEEGEGEDVGPAERGRSLRRRQHRCVRG